jgi:hypothetical protein
VVTRNGAGSNEEGSKSFRLVGSGQLREREAPVFAKAREAARGAWEDFVREAKPTAEQQQTLLSAVYDGQLYRAEVEKVEGEWGTDWAYDGRDKAGPFPDADWMDDVQNAVCARASEVLDEKQNKIFLNYFGGLAIVLAVQGDLVQPAPG